MSNQQERFDRAKWWLAQGFDVVPLQPQSKYLVKGFGAHSRHITGEPLARRWFVGQDANLGVVLGFPSGPQALAVADFDDVAGYEKWRAGIGQAVETLIEQTARGYHVFFVGEQLPSGAVTRVEFKTSGVTMVAPSVHPTGAVYRVITEAPIARITPEQTTLLFPFVSALLAQRQEAVTAHSPVVPQKKLEAPGQDLIGRIKAARPVSEEAATLTQLRGGGKHFSARCPFHDDQHASMWVDDEAGLWGCYAPLCPTNAKGVKAHDVINLRQWAKHSSVRDAIRDLADELFPRPVKSRPARRKK